MVGHADTPSRTTRLPMTRAPLLIPAILERVQRSLSSSSTIYLNFHSKSLHTRAAAQACRQDSQKPSLQLQYRMQLLASSSTTFKSMLSFQLWSACPSCDLTSLFLLLPTPENKMLGLTRARSACRRGTTHMSALARGSTSIVLPGQNFLRRSKSLVKLNPHNNPVLKLKPQKSFQSRKNPSIRGELVVTCFCVC